MPPGRAVFLCHATRGLRGPGPRGKGFTPAPRSGEQPRQLARLPGTRGQKRRNALRAGAERRRAEGDGAHYEEVYRGVLCDTPGVGAPKKDERWRVVPTDPRTYIKESDRPRPKR